MLRVHIFLHVAYCRLYGEDPHQWIKSSKSRMKRLSMDRGSWEYRAMTEAEVTEANWDTAIWGG